MKLTLRAFAGTGLLALTGAWPALTFKIDFLATTSAQEQKAFLDAANRLSRCRRTT